MAQRIPPKLLEFSRLLNPKSECDYRDSFKVVLDVMEKVLNEHSAKRWNQMEHDGNMLFQVILLRGISIGRLIEDKSYVNALDGRQWSITVDPLSLETLVRAQFEAFCLFHHIYLKPTTPAEREMYYLLWVIAGLNKRQKTVSRLTIPALLRKAAKEKIELEGWLDKLWANAEYNALDAKGKKAVKDAVKDKKYQVILSTGSARSAGWQALFKRAVPTDAFEQFYMMLSQASHPSNVSMFQFRDMYKDGTYRSTAYFALQCSTILMAFTIRDYVKLFPILEVVVNGLKEEHQLLINNLNIAFRGDDYTLNDIEEHMGLKPSLIPGFIRVPFPGPNLKDT